MAKFTEPPPPAQLAQVEPAWKLLPAGTLIWRIYFRAGWFPTTWKDLRWHGPTASRFDHHPEPPGVHPQGILYAAFDPKTALAEVFQQRQLRTRDYSPWLVGFALARDVRLLDLISAWPTRAGASMAISSSLRARARRWSRAIHAAYPEAHGLHYPSSMNAGQPQVALYERAQSAMPRQPVFHTALADRKLLDVLRLYAEELGYLLL